MKVLCIETAWTFVGPEKKRIPQFGNSYTVTRADKALDDQREYYKLAGFGMWWEATAFIPLSDIDETDRTLRPEAVPEKGK